MSECNLDCPVVSSILQYVKWSLLLCTVCFSIWLQFVILETIYRYDAMMDVTDSDHKPVRCKFNVKIAHVDRSIRRKEFGEILTSNEKIRSMLEELRYVPETTVIPNSIVLQNKDTAILRITNKSMKDKAIYKISCEGQSALNFSPRGAFGFPRWLEVTLLSVIILDFKIFPRIYFKCKFCCI